MPIPQHRVDDRILRFRLAWGELAPQATFAGMTLAQFTEATQPPLEEREQLSLLALMQAAALRRRGAADVAARDRLALVIDAVRGDPAYGEDSALYRALGYIPKSERRSGLTRKVSTTATTPAARHPAAA